MSVRQALYSISLWLGSFPSLGYALTYLAVIPIFGFIYFELPSDSFHHSTIQHEEAFEVQNLKVEHGLQYFINRGFGMKDDWSGGTDKALSNGWRIHPGWPREVQVKQRYETEVNFVIEVFVINQTPDEIERLGQHPVMIDVPVNFTFYRLSTIGPQKEIPLETERAIPLNFGPVRPVEGQVSISDIERELQNVLFDNAPDAPTTKFKVTQDFLNEVVNFANGNQGVGARLPGNYWRMLYLSSVTITTVGYGDIVPLTTSARILVSIEAVLGIVLIGLFLNALSFERSRDRKPKRKKTSNAPHTSGH